MKTVIYITMAIFLLSCSKQSSLSVKKQHSYDESATYKKLATEKQNTFISTLSSFIPVDGFESNEELSWKDYLKDYLLDPNFIFYIMSFILVMWVLFIGTKYRHNFIKNKTINI